MRPAILLSGCVAALAGLGTAATSSVAPPQERDLEAAFEALGGEDAASRTAAFDELVELGEPALLRALADFQGADFRGRRARAVLLDELITAEVVPDVVALIADPDPVVRSRLVQALGSSSLADAGLAERIAALRDVLLADPDERVRSAALRALAGFGVAGSVDALDRALDELAPSEAADAARELARMPAARLRVVGRVMDAFAGSDDELAFPVLAGLFSGYGRALAELPSGGGRAEELAPFTLGARHPDTRVQREARGALDDFIARLGEFAELERLDGALARLIAQGFEPQALLYRRTALALSEGGDPERTIELARALVQSARVAPADEEPTWRFYGLYFEGLARLAAQEPNAARLAFDAAALTMRRLTGERLDLQPDVTSGSAIGGAVVTDRLQLVALAELGRGLALLAGEPDRPSTETLELLRGAHVLSLESRRVADRSRAQSVTTLDALLERDIGPHRMVLANHNLAWTEGAGLDLALAFGRAMATVAPWEMPGFEPYATEERRLRDPLADRERLELLRAVREAMRHGLEQDRSDLRQQSSDANSRQQMRWFDYQIGMIAKEEAEERTALARLGPGAAPGEAELRSLFAGLVRRLTPSSYALTLAGDLRVEGRAEDARALARRMLDDARDLPTTTSIWTEWLSARLELLIGSTWMDVGEPREAEAACLNAVRRLQALENTLERQLESAADSPSDAASLRSQVLVTRQNRANALLSLAVNANVRMNDQERALAYFERAYELDQRDFMRVLLACYRARSGRAEEARAVLRGVEPAPQLYYNLACTHALLGEADDALDYLQRELAENHPSAGSRRRQLEWAREDPDLASLRGDPRFERLLAGE